MNKFLFLLICICLSVGCFAGAASTNRVNFGKMVDLRDGQEYKTVKIGNQIWMAENLNYETAHSYCYDNRMSNCIKYGRLYEWENALTACPVGFHLPTLQEWKALFETVGGIESAGIALKFTGVWDYDLKNYSGHCTDAYGLGVIPAGVRSDSGTYNSEGLNAGFWSSTEVVSSLAYSVLMGYNFINVRLYEAFKNYAYSIRCLKGKPEKSINSKAVDSPVYSKGVLKDSRDGKKYRVVRIGEQIWMAENLNYDANESACYKNSLENCRKYGRLYTWSVAKNVCPIGYHLPSLDEWRILFESAGGRFDAGRVLKSKIGWINGGVGTDDYGFSAFPVGGSENFEGEQAYFWSYADYRNETAYYMTLKNNSDMAYLLDGNGKNKYSVRCLKNQTSKSGKKDKLSSVNVSSVVRGSLKDSRDGKVYKTTKIGNQIWMAENLNYKTAGSFCYLDSAQYCDKYGRFYTWSAAMDSAGSFSVHGRGCGDGEKCAPVFPVRGACPVGWHLPTLMEWNTLIAAVGGKMDAASRLLSEKSWNDDFDWVDGGTDDYGFSAFPGCYIDDKGKKGFCNPPVSFWSSIECSSDQAYHMQLQHSSGYSGKGVRMLCGGKSSTLAIRCVKD